MSEVEIFNCEKCDKKFTTKFSLNRHQFIHSNVKRFQCRFCPKKFALKQYLKEHECIHTNDRPYVCGVNGCNQRFRQRGKLSLHRRKHRGYKMKEYALIKKNGEGSDYDSYSDLMDKNTHQYESHSINDISDVPEEAKSASKAKPTRRANKLKRTHGELNDTDSEFEMPTYSTKQKMVDNQRTSKRQRKVSYKVKDYLSDESVTGIDRLDQPESLDSKSVVAVDNTYPNMNSSNIQTNKKESKKSEDYTVRLEDCDEAKHEKEVTKPHSTFGKPQATSKPRSNFWALLRAYKVHENLQSTKACEQEKCEENKIEPVPMSLPEPSQDVCLNDLSCAVRLMEPQNFNYLLSGASTLALTTHIANKNGYL